MGFKLWVNKNAATVKIFVKKKIEKAKANIYLAIMNKVNKC